MKITLPLPFVAIYHEEVTSTMDVVVGEALSENAWPFVIAGAQTQARGRLGRAWQAPSGNFMGSFMLPLDKQADASTLALIVGMAAQKTLSSLAPEAVFKVKWPNDILAQGADGTFGKFGGILVETKGVGTDSFRAIVGMGLNLAHAPAALVNPNPLLPKAFSGTDLGAPLQVSAVAEVFCGAFLPLFKTWQDSGFAPLVESYNAVLWRLNEEISVSTAADKSDARLGFNRGVDEGGVLQLETASGLESIRVGEL